MTLPEAPVWPGRARSGRWLADLLLGARLARGGNRSGRLRVALTAAGIGATVVVLLCAASIGHIRAAQLQREIAGSYDPAGPLPGVDPLYLRDVSELYEGREIHVRYVRPGGPRAPLPPGLARLPDPGEQVVSPALGRLMAAPAGAPVRSRYPARTVGTIGRAGLPGGPGELTVLVGSADVRATPVYRFGALEPWSNPLPPLLWTLLVVGAVVLLTPMLVLVVAVSRLSAADRRRRLAAIRLVGASARQTRRIAAGEVLAGALAGLLTGTALFLAARALVESDTFSSVAVFGGVRPFTADVVPSWPLAVLIAVLVPGLAVLTAVAALRRTLVEPLEVVRQATAGRLRLLWRLAPAVAGTGLLVVADAATALSGSARTGPVLVAGTVLILLSLPLLLPWLVQRVVRRPRDETPALQLASRRLQLDGGPAARLAAGVAVALAGAIGLSALLGSAQDRYATVPQQQPLDRATVELTPPVDVAGLAGTLRVVPGVRAVDRVQRLPLTDEGAMFTMLVAPCRVLRTMARLPSCVDGQMYGPPGFEIGRTVQVVLADGRPTPDTVRLPAGLEPVDSMDPQLLATPGSVRPIPPGRFLPMFSLTLDPGDPGAIERVRAAMAPAGWRADVRSGADLIGPTQSFSDLVAIRRALFAGAELTLALAAVALLVLCLQQVRDARRPLAALAATGVPRAVLARSILWQNTILAVPALLLADAAGIGLGALLLPIVGSVVSVDWPAVLMLTAAALGTVAVTTILVLPTVRTATRPTGLRTE
jgi:hypothetical protein